MGELLPLTIFTAHYSLNKYINMQLNQERPMGVKKINSCILNKSKDFFLKFGTHNLINKCRNVKKIKVFITLKKIMSNWNIESYTKSKLIRVFWREILENKSRKQLVDSAGDEFGNVSTNYYCS